MSEEQVRRQDGADVPQASAPVSIFIDESYSNRDYYVGAVLMTADQVADLESRFEEIRQFARFKWGVPDKVEFHAYDIMQGKNDWRVMYGRVGDAASLYGKLLRAIVASGARVAVQGVDVVRLNLRFQYPATPYEVVCRRALEQIHSWCEQDGLDAVPVFADSVRPDLGAATAAFKRITDGTSLAASSGRPGPLARIGTVNLVESCDHSGVQAADLAAHIVRRYLEEVKAAPAARRLARSLCNTLEPALKYSAKWRP
jgi:hypothetical protein